MNTVTYIANPETLRVTKELLTGTPITLDCKRPINTTSEPHASSTFSTPDIANNNVQEYFIYWFGTLLSFFQLLSV